MAKSKTKSKVPKGNKRFKQGYVSFSPEDLKQQAQADPANAEAYDLLDQAMTTSSNVSAHSKKSFENGGNISIDDVYPVSLEETNEMDRLLDEAERKAGNPNDPIFAERLDELRGIVHWSRKRHYNFSWLVILGVFIMVCFLFHVSGKRKEDVREAKAKVEQVKAWQEMDTTLTIGSRKAIWEKCNNYGAQLRNANAYKINELNGYAYDYYSSLQYAEDYTYRSDTATSKDQIKYYRDYAKEYTEKAKNSKEKFEELNGKKFKEIKKEALKEVKKAARAAKRKSTFILFWNLLFIFLIPLYIFADRPYGYMETRHRAEARVMGGIRKVAFGIAGFLAGSAFAMDYLPDTKVKWSDGSTTTESDTSNFIIIAIKLFMYAAAIIILSFVSCFLILYSTITGLYRNYDWSKISGKSKKNVEA